MGGSITRWSATRKSIQKRVESLFKKLHPTNAKIKPETIVHHREDDNDYDCKGLNQLYKKH